MNFTKIASLICACMFCAFSTQANGMSTSQRTVRAERRETNRTLPERERMLSIKKEEAREQIQLLKSLLFLDKSPEILLHINKKAAQIYSENTDLKIRAEARMLRANITAYSLQDEHSDNNPLPEFVASTELK